MMANGNAAHEVFILMTTVIGSAGSTVTLSMGRKMLPVRAPVLARVRLSAIAAPSNGVPSWNVTPARALMVHSVESAFGVIDSARYGAALPSAVGIASVS